MKPILTDKVQIDKNGRLTLPRSIWSTCLIQEGTQGPIDLKIQLMDDGTIQLIPKTPHRYSNYMDSDPEMTKSAARAYLQGKEKKYVSEQEIDDLLKD